jgi:hypothetical protein
MEGIKEKGLEMAQTDHERAAEQRKKRLEKYFRKTPDPGENSLALTLLCGSALSAFIALIIFASGGSGLWVIFLAAAAYSGYKGYEKKSDYDRRYKASEPKPSDEEMDRQLAADLTDIERRAMRQLGLTNDELELVSEQWDPIANLERGNPLIDSTSRRPSLVFGPLVSSHAAVGTDGVWRFSAYEVMVICPTGYHLAMYRCGIDFLTGGLRQEETQEYHYSDVVAVSTITSPGTELSAEPTDLKYDHEIKFAKTVLREFQIVVSSGDRSKIVVGIMDEDQPDRQAPLQESGIGQVISSVRRMLREKKGGVTRPPGSGMWQ